MSRPFTTTTTQNMTSSGVTWTTVQTVGSGGSGGMGQTPSAYALGTYLVIVFPYGVSHSEAPMQFYDKGEMYIVDAMSRSTALERVRNVVGNRPMFVMEGNIS